MRIKKLEICGFKSFVDRTVLTFEDPITAVVGPNGCGKSNIVDAIRWVMGEQSAKHLRGRSMEDVIFNGSDTRDPADLAEVSLTFDASALPSAAAPGGVPWGAVRPDEIVVTRRLGRDGESEYLLGGVPCRLRDVVDFFLGTGVGSKAYAIIEQGRIGFIVSSRPEDRRALIDEAARITKYKARKKVAERRMEATRQHLLRVSDVIGELETRLRSLRLQAQKAERYKRYRAELRDLDLRCAAQRALGIIAEAKVSGAERDRLEGDHLAEATRLEAEQAAIDTERLEVGVEAADLAAAKEEVLRLAHQAEMAAHDAQHHEDESSALEARAEASEAEVAALGERAERAAHEVEALAARLGSAEADAGARAHELGKVEAGYAGLREDLDTARRELDQALSASATARAETARLEADRAAAAERQRDLAARIDTGAAEAAGMAQRLAEQAGRALTLGDEIADLDRRGASLLVERAAAEARLGELKAQASRGELELETLREEAHRRRSRLHSLAEIQTRYESFQRGVRAIMQRARIGESAPDPGTDVVPDAGAGRWALGAGVKGLVADIVQPPAELESAVEAVLGERLGNIIVESHDVGLEAIEYLKTRSEGRSSFIPLGLRAPPGRPRGEVLYDGGPAGQAAEAAWPSGDGVRGPMLELIGFDRAYDRVAAYLLGDVLVVEDLRRALALWRETHTDKTIVTLDGEVLDPQGVVTGGSRESALTGVLGQKREIRELEELVARIEDDLRAALDRQVGVKQALAGVGADRDRLDGEVRALDLDRVGHRKDRDRAFDDRADLERRRADVDRSLAELRAAVAHAEAQVARTATDLALETSRGDSADAHARERRTAVDGLARALDDHLATLTAAKIAAAQADDRRRSTEAELVRLRTERDEQRSRAARLQVSLREDRERATTLRSEAVRLRDEVARTGAEGAERASTHAAGQAALEARQASLAHRESDARALRARVSVLADDLSTMTMRCQELRLRHAALEDQTADRYPDVRLADVLGDHHLAAPVGEGEDARVKELRQLIERMGEINVHAIDESREHQQRFDFLSAQRADLDSALARLETAIEKINRASRKRFREVFDAVNQKFQEVFPKLFGGGRAMLALTDERDLLETGVEIIANPPGKRIMQNIELLSGGEKALTAVSLLFAIFLVRPSPFCLLDEVDAPLDEANVTRFNQMVRQMTDRSQFILISHNRRTMECADSLSGITMEEPGVSKLVSVNLRGAAARRPKAETADLATAAPEMGSVA